MQRFAGRTAIITGGGRGIGLSIAARLVREGAQVVITGRDESVLDAAVEGLGGPTHALGAPGDVIDVEHQKSTVRLAIDTFGGADLLVNNAGAASGTPAIDIDLTEARRVVEINALAALSWTQQAHRAWLADHGGAVVNLSSVAALRPSATGPLYGPSKALLTEITKALALTLGPGVRVNGVAPAVVKTDFAAPIYEGEDKEQKLASKYPLKRLGLPEDISGGVAFLLSDDAAWITGHLLVIDGGLMLIQGT